MPQYFISAGIELTEGSDLKETQDGLKELVKHTQQEPGCVLFEIRQNLEDRAQFTLWECWTDPEALKAHFEADHTKAFLARGLTKINYIEKLGLIGDTTFQPEAVDH